MRQKVCTSKKQPTGARRSHQAESAKLEARWCRESQISSNPLVPGLHSSGTDNCSSIMSPDGPHQVKPWYRCVCGLSAKSLHVSRVSVRSPWE